MKVTCVVDDRELPDSRLRAEHGVSFLLEAQGRTVLFDMGQTASVLLHNLSVLGAAPEQIEALVLSHAHYDHMGGLERLLERLPGVPTYAHPDLFRERFRKTDAGPKRLGPAMDRASLADRASLRLSARPVGVIAGVWTTGEIAPRPEPEGRSRQHIVRKDRGWASDPYRDDLSLVPDTGEGLVLLCGCCHAGLLNTLVTVRSVFGRDPIAVVGGIHLVHADTPTLNHVVAKLRQHGPPGCAWDTAPATGASWGLWPGWVTGCPSAKLGQYSNSENHAWPVPCHAAVHPRHSSCRAIHTLSALYRCEPTCREREVTRAGPFPVPEPTGSPRR
jgi:7,8-dihydropterin-6-yl-methyl-4-(beta-D-ribofuranosyl)aminobenzene 5'-phosphate synthase